LGFFFWPAGRRPRKNFAVGSRISETPAPEPVTQRPVAPRRENLKSRFFLLLVFFFGKVVFWATLHREKIPPNPGPPPYPPRERGTQCSLTPARRQRFPAERAGQRCPPPPPKIKKPTVGPHPTPTQKFPFFCLGTFVFAPKPPPLPPPFVSYEIFFYLNV